MTDETTTEWCAGMPLVLRRPFEEAELQSLRKEAVRYRWLGLGSLFLFPASCAALAFVVTWSNPAFVVAQSILALGLILLITVSLPVSMLLARDCFQRSKGLFGDLKCGYAKRFVGPLFPKDAPDETLLKLRRAHLAPKGNVEAWGMETLPASGRVWNIMGQPVSAWKWVIARTVVVAQTPEIAAIAAQWLQPVAREEKKTLMGGQRELSASEREELRRYARRLWLKPLPFAAGLTLWVLMPITVLFLQHHLDNALSWFQFLFLAVSAASADFHFVLAARRSGRMSKDARGGQVIILREEEKTSSDLAGEARTTEAIELLPVSRMIWTGNGIPAAWRVIQS